MQQLMVEMIPQWLVRSALSTSDALCGTFHHRRRPEETTYPLHRHRSQRGHGDDSPPSREPSHADEESSDDDEEDEEEQDLELRMIRAASKSALCMQGVWRDLDPSLVAADLLSMASSPNKVPREVVVDAGRQSPVSLLFQGSQYTADRAPPRPLSRTAPLSPYDTPSYYTKKVLGRTYASSLELESVSMLEEEDSLLDGLEQDDFYRTLQPPPPPPDRKKSAGLTDKAFASPQSSIGLSLMSSQIQSPPMIQRKQHVTYMTRPKYTDHFAPSDHDTFITDWKMEEDGTKMTELNLQEEVSEESVADFLVSGSSQCTSKQEQVDNARRDPPEEQEGGSTAFFTYSTQDSTSYRFYQEEEEGVETVISHTEEPMSASAISNRQQFADGSSYSSVASIDDDASSVGYSDTDIMNAASAVKCMLMGKMSPKQLQSSRKESRQGIFTPRIHRGHWFLPSPGSSASREALSTPSQSIVTSQSIDESSV